jgi:LAGLIDADG DNA endonuclease family protein
MNKEQMAAYIAAMVDGEGHVGCHRLKKEAPHGHYTRTIHISNTDRALIDFVTHCFNSLGFTTYEHKKNRPNFKHKPCWAVYISASKENFQKFLELIPIQAPKKQAALRNIISSYLTKEQQRDIRRNGEVRSCQICKTEFYISAAFIARGEGLFCSKGCVGISQRAERPERICPTCNKSFYPKSRTSKLCSKACIRETKIKRCQRMAAYAAAKRWGHI